ncbi:hypothetical protein A9Z63_08260 [Moraxella lacunata]|uniref:Uncharacterized protein n=1 Tax=Moraxella lacunata TaxID=477 RepID=A0A1B8PZ31_MORLA|nr:hypothetical protein A9Z63_08260 [Moraxella lacunata]OBX61459.1 hypothetical protein A9309_08410 [Moraxella lacunata]
MVKKQGQMVNQRDLKMLEVRRGLIVKKDLYMLMKEIAIQKNTVSPVKSVVTLSAMATPPNFPKTAKVVKSVVRQIKCLYNQTPITLSFK